MLQAEYLLYIALILRFVSAQLRRHALQKFKVQPHLDIAAFQVSRTRSILRQLSLRNAFGHSLPTYCREPIFHFRLTRTLKKTIRSYSLETLIKLSLPPSGDSPRDEQPT